MPEVKITKRRLYKCRKRWTTISARFSNGKEEELAKFKYAGDMHPYLKQLQAGSGTVEEIFID